MYINPVLVGVVGTLFVEIVVIIIYSVWTWKGKR